MKILKVIEVLSDSKNSWEDAAAQGVAKASKSVKHIQSAFVQNQSVTVMDGKIEDYRVNLKITFEVRD